MAFTDLGNLATGGSTVAVPAPPVSPFSIAVPTTAACAAGELVVVVVAIDNAFYLLPLAEREAAEPRYMGGGQIISRVTIDGIQLQQVEFSGPGNAGAQQSLTGSMYAGQLPRAVASGALIDVEISESNLADHLALVARHFSVGGVPQIVSNVSTLASDAGVTSDPPSMDITVGGADATNQTLRIRSYCARYNGTSAAVIFSPTSGWTMWGPGQSGGQNITPDWELYANAEHFIGTGANKVSDPSLFQTAQNANSYVVFREGPITGTLAATEGSDTASFNGGVNVIYGTLEALEGAVQITADSTLYTADNDVIRVDTVPTFGDTASFLGTVVTSNNGVLAATEARDTAAFTGLVGAIGTLAATEGADTAAFTGSVAWLGTLAAVEGSDTASFTGTVAWAAITGTLAATEDADTADFHGVYGVVGGPLEAIEEPDTASFTGEVAWTAVLDATEDADTADFSGMLGVIGTLAAVEAEDTFAGEAYLSLVDEKHGVLDAYEDRVGGYTEPTADSTLVTADNEVFHVSIDYYGQDRALFVGEVVTHAQLVAVEGSDTASFVGSVAISGVLAATESGGDTAAFSGQVATVISGRLAAQEGSDVAAFSGQVAWHQIGEGVGEGAENEVQRTVWLVCPKRETFLKNEVGRTSSLTNPEPRVVFLRSEVQRIDDLAEAA